MDSINWEAKHNGGYVPLYITNECVTTKDVLRFKDEPTVVGFMVRTSQNCKYLSDEEKDDVLKALQWCCRTLWMKMTCILDRLKDDESTQAYWLRKFSTACRIFNYGEELLDPVFTDVDWEAINEAYYAVFPRFRPKTQ
jgi:hypothetical protein